MSFKTRGECKQYLLKNKFVVIKVSAKWCGPCNRISSLVEACLEELPANVTTIIVDFDVHRDVASALRIKNVPTFLFYIDGMPDICLVGANKQKVQKFFQDVNQKVLRG
ncbi:MAG: thioredoxin family protein [Candidatus Neomarinimicrobiota bacterium]